MIELLDACMQRSAVFAERHGEQEILLGRVAQQKGALRFALQQPFGLVPVHFAPIEAAAGDLLQVGHQTMNEFHLNDTDKD